MPFDVFGWSPRNELGFGGYQTGDYFKSVYGYDDAGNAVNNPQQWNQIQQQRMGMGQPKPPQQAPLSGNDFFSQLAGLMGSGMPAQAAGPNPNIPAQGQFNLGQAIANPGNQYRQIITPGGQGPYGGVSKEGQRAMFEGNAKAWGQFQQGGGRAPGLGYGPTPSSPYVPERRPMRDPMNRGVGPGRGMSSGRASAGRNPLSNLPNRGGSL